MSEGPVNVSPDTHFDKATPDQFRAFWEAQGWTVEKQSLASAALMASRITAIDNTVYVWQDGKLSLADPGEFAGCPGSFLMVFPATFGEALRLANNLAQAELFGGWAE